MDLSKSLKRLETIQRDKNKHTTIEVWLGEWDEKENEYPKSLRSNDKTIVFKNENEFKEWINSNDVIKVTGEE